MSQATFDPTTPGGPADDAGETRAARPQTRRRPTRRGHAASAKPAEATTTTTTTTPAAPVAVAPAQPEREPAAPPTADEQATRGESRRSRSRGGAKRPATRGKASAQLIITKTDDEAQPEAAQTEAPATAEPVIVPIVTTGAEPAPRKTRFGQPRRFRQGEEAPATTQAPATPAPASAPVAEAEAEPAPAAEAARRYRFDRTRSALTSASAARPERISAQPPASLYTTPAVSASEAPMLTPPVAEPAAEPLFDLPSLESLVGGAGAELPTLAFAEPEPLTTELESAEAAGAEEGAELAEGVAGASRRRRRRRRGATAAHNGAHGADLEEAAEEEGLPLAELDTLESTLFGEEAPELPEPIYPEPQREPRAPVEPQREPRGRSGRYGYTSHTPRRATPEPTWESAPPPAETSPYGSPEPAFARGFGPTPSGVATPARETYQRPSRIERGEGATTASVAQLGSVIREAINTQTDRLLSELRRQQPPAVTLSIPNAQTAERVGVFVDVANVVYSARNLRASVDFGHLLDFLRANRRLARAQAYAPTDPTPGSEQAFLNAVKGLGYRITTKNYKTFANGAKKADLDLDLCMDIVRIVDAKAVDTIVLVSGDSDFLPLLDYCSDHGVRVEVAAFDDAASMILRQSCDLFVNLSLVEGIRG